MKIGYQRVSTVIQREARQEKALEEYGVERLYLDKASGKNAERPQLKEMLSYVREGDCVVVESISRIARNTKDLLCILEDLEKKKVAFISLKENIDTTTPAGRFMITVFGACAELEREYIVDRTREGVAIAKSQGKMKGKQPMKLDKDKFMAVCKRWRAGEITAVKAMEILEVKPNTFYRRVREWQL